MKTYIVVGAGILGASTAYHLAKAGACVTLVDRKEPGQATAAAAGIVCPWLSQRRNQDWYRLAKGGARYYADLIKQLEEDGETDTGYKRVGAISIHTDAAKLDKMEERAYKRREDAPEIGEITRLSADETKKLFPLLSEEYESVHISGAARVNGRALCRSLVSAARKHGAVILYDNAKLLYEGNHVRGIETENETLLADQVIVTAGAWASEILKPLGIDFQVTYQKAQIVHFEMPDNDTGEWPVVMPPSDQYLLAFANGRIVAGATHENEAVLGDCRVTAGGVSDILNKALTIAPGLSESTILEERVGFRPFTPGFLPVIGALPNVKGLLIANGLGASGLTSGPFLGAELAKLALGKQTELDLSHYDPAGALHNN
ncbi:NAD(P)/FAD-dependent oxidoreductase [Bacillus atrophaeus]|uniref:NAD(P)/FAD-dependent oxidoreductase n=1 Tax=Bacillus atrophaeus TaxID=1452 RepID=UPI000330CA1B|nr:FAD-binding oxidoreductase [Bacillus atrophaeus]AKL86250.1 YurR [Bacillus atrophaeus UCMB-5137]MBU5261793.1 FAD-binding oxidoreductase [Bacillus atrophaeus]QUF64656.1 FAD-binding oxidoreductase [Bacillus atrophaeus]WFE13500.1 FAD-binding oxidoreductase [Bacillus atrophaeus]